MRTILVLFVFLLLASTAYADICTDTDGGRNYGVKGSAKYAITQKEDFCVISPSAEIHADTSNYLKEYYCQNDKMESEIVDCTREGFDRCELGKCTGGTEGAKATGNYTAPPPVAECGNSVVDAGEDCDPVNKMCFDDDGNVGLCDENCQCEVKIVWDGSKKTKTEENETTEIDEVKPVEKEVEETEKKEEAPPVVVEKEEDKEITVTIAEKPKKTAPKGFFARIWAWFAGLFS